MTETTKNQLFNAHLLSTVLHDAGGRDIVIFCHGFRGTSTGPQRFFVRAARLLETKGVSSLRFDQFGSGNSPGDFKDSSFNDWIETIRAIARDHIERGFNVALFGQSMGASAAIAAATQLPGLTAIVGWAPDPEIEDFMAPPESLVEEAGQVVEARFWQEAHTARVADKLATLDIPVYIVQCGADEYVDAKNCEAIAKHATARHTVETLEGHVHSAWTYAQSEEIINRSVAFLKKSFPAMVAPAPPSPSKPAPVIRPAAVAASAASAATDDDVKQKIAALLREAEVQKKPPFGHGKHAMWALMTCGLSVPIWVFAWVQHNNEWREKQNKGLS